MARARFIRPEFFTDEKVSDLPFGACMLFAGIWCHSDLRGVFERSPRLLRGLIFPMRDGIDIATVGKWLDEMEAAGLIGRFEADGKTWGFVKNWEKHQQISGRERDIGSDRPGPPEHAQACSEHVPRTGQERVRAASPTSTPTPTPTAAVTRAPEAPPPPPEPDLFDQRGPPPLQIAKAKTFGDFQAMHARVYVPREERDAWEATLAAWGWEPMAEGYAALAAKLTDRKHRVLLSQLTAWLDQHYELEKPK